MTKRRFLYYALSLVLVFVSFVDISCRGGQAKQGTKVVSSCAKKCGKSKPKTEKGNLRPVPYTCPSCNGSGYNNGVKCSSCEGTGKKVRFVRE